MLQTFSGLAQRRQAIADAVEGQIQANLAARQPGPRNQAADDNLFGPLNTAIILAVAQGDFRFAMLMFSTCYAHALEYERVNQCQIHKGAPTFNVGIAHLRAFDFPAAMHFFELAQEETRFTSGQASWGVYLNELFDRNFWDTVDAAQGQYPVTQYNQLWGVDFDKTLAKANWRRVSNQSKLLYITSLARRIRYRQLETASHWDDSDSLSLAYWNLTADLSRLLETEIYRRAHHRVNPANAWKLYELVTRGFLNTRRLGDISSYVRTLSNTHGVNSTQRYNAAFTTLRNGILNTNLSKRERVAYAVYLLYATRNQVQHHVDTKMVLYKRPNTARFVVDTLISLCRLDSWTF